MVIDILALLRAFGGKLENVKVYGKISARLNRPSNLMSNCFESGNGIYVRVDIFAINLSYYKSYLKDYGYTEKDGIYLVAEGSSLCTYVPMQGYKYPDFYTIDGTLRIGSKTSNDYCVMFNFHKANSNWTIKCNNIYDVDIDSWSDNTQHKRLGLRMLQSNVVEYAPESKGLCPTRCIDTRIQVKKPQNEEYIQEQNITKSISNKYESRLEIKEYSKIKQELQGKSDDAKSSRLKFINQLKIDYSSPDEEHIKRLVNALRTNLKHKANPLGNTGRAILLKYLKEFKNAESNYLGKRKVCDFLIDDFDEIAEMILNGSEVSINGTAWSVCRNAFGSPETFYAGVVSKIIGINTETLINIEQICSKNNIYFSKLINTNPYALQLISPLSFRDIEHIALCFGKSNNISIESFRNISILDSFINDRNDGSTLFIKSELSHKKLGMYFTEADYKKVQQRGTYLSDTVISDINTYLGTKITPYEISGYYKSGYNYVKPFSSSEISKIIDDYVKCGLGIDFNQYVTSSNYLDKELYVYEKLYTLGKKPTNFDEDLIAKYINEYEDKIGFKLEKEQFDAVMLLKHKAGATAGSAGSGKTTTSNCFVYVLEKLMPGIELKFAAPTGRASKRMQEVVKRPVSTMASMFRIGLESVSGVFEEENYQGTESEVAYFFDECAMVTIDLLYSILRKIDSSCYLYLFGDYHQLPPIGKGVPFKNLLRFMPCVFLTVSKRAAEGSQITNAANIINEYSESYNWKELQSGDDFFLCPCSDEIMYNLTIALCKHYLGKPKSSEEIALLSRYFNNLPSIPNLTQDDIQIVTPIAKATYKWGSTQLNKVLEPIFNTNRGYSMSFTYYKAVNSQFYNKFTIGDRVVHKDVNMYSMQWYSTYKDGQFQKIYGCGICNGEVGTIVAFYPASTCEFFDEIEDKPDDFDYKDNLRDDSSFNSLDNWFVVVKYHDYMKDRDFYILYRCSEVSSVSNNVGKPFTGDDLSLLDLFYAGTTHKLQGSQAKIVISLLGVVNFKGFITRNMMYTVYTRGESLVFALGSVGNERNSMLSIARTEIAEKDILTVGEIL